MEDDQRPDAARINAVLEQCYEQINRYPELKSKVSFVLRKKTESARGYIPRLKAFQGPDSDTLATLTQHADIWTKEPRCFTEWTRNDGFALVLGEPYAPLTYLTLRCIQTQREGAVATMRRRVYRVVLSRMQKRYKVTAAALAASLAQHWTKENLGEDLESCVNSMLDAGSRLDYWVEKLGSGAIFYMGQELGNDMWERDIPKSGRNHKLAMDHLKSIDFERHASIYTPMGEVILRQVTRDAEIWLGPVTADPVHTWWSGGLEVRALSFPGDIHATLAYDPVASVANAYTMQ